MPPCRSGRCQPGEAAIVGADSVLLGRVTATTFPGGFLEKAEELYGMVQVPPEPGRDANTHKPPSRGK